MHHHAPTGMSPEIILLHYVT